jgi:hypothetical protein
MLRKKSYCLRNTSKILANKAERKRSLYKPRHSWNDAVPRGRYGLALYGSEQRPMASSCEHTNKPPSSTQGGDSHKNTLQWNMFISCLYMLLKQITLFLFCQPLLVLLCMDMY